MRVNDPLRKELMAECLGSGLHFSTGEAMVTQLINNFVAAAFCAFKDFDTSSEGDCNTELIRAEQVSNVGNWERF